ncbi:hypothetical protein [Phocaeicola sp.]
MKDKANIQSKSKPIKTTISISEETSERLEYTARQTAYSVKSLFHSHWTISSAQAPT